MWLLALSVAAGEYVPSSITPAKPLKEMRGAWIATVANIDWPSTNATTTAQQKAELVRLLDQAQALRLNTLIFQVRPGCDAMYQSTLEPWSEYLTGTMGKAPEPFFDPLALAVEEAHKRGLELHAWFNPYRARHALAKSSISANHISRTHPEFVRQYGKSLWLDPGLPAARDYSIKVIMDVVRRYDIDGVHLDDYFYPYKEKDASGKELEFPDATSWQSYGVARKMSREDWRRDNINAFVERLQSSIKTAKPWVKFGISPFGIWRPGNPPQVQGFDAYAQIYADSRKWLANGWVDYFSPQLYWAIDAPEQRFPVLLKWWSEQNVRNRLLVPGLASTKVAAGPWTPGEILEQIRISRQQEGVSGQIHWNISALLRNSALASALQRGPYAEPALIPGCTWQRRSAPEKPVVSATQNGKTSTVMFKPSDPETVSVWLLQSRCDGAWRTAVLPRERRSFAFDSLTPEAIAVSVVDRYGNVGRPAVVARQARTD